VSPWGAAQRDAVQGQSQEQLLTHSVRYRAVPGGMMVPLEGGVLRGRCTRAGQPQRYGVP
jgi:hypothetical protein